MSVALKIYRRLARAFPHEFKLTYGPEVLQAGEDEVDDVARRHGFAGIVRLLADIAVRVPMEYLSEMRRDMSYALRALIKSPGFALVGIVSMGIGDHHALQLEMGADLTKAAGSDECRSPGDAGQAGFVLLH